MHRKQRAYWGWSQPEWSNFFCPSWREFVAKYPGEKQCRSHLMAAAYLLELFDDLKTIGSFKRSTLAEHIFGEDRLGSACQNVLQTRETCGTEAKSRPYGLRQCVSQLLLRQRSPELANMTIELLEQTRSSSVSARFNHNLHAVSRALLSLGILRRPLSCGWRAGKNWIEGTATEGVPEEWAKWVDRWRETSALRPKTRYRIYVLLQQTGRWLGAKHPEACHPEQWTRDLAAKYVAAICQMKVGEWVRCSATLRSPSYGKPAAPRTRVAFLAAVRLFFRDCQEWEWISRRFNPGQCLVPPRNLRALIKTNPRVIDERERLRVFRENGCKISRKRHVRAHEHAIATGHRQTHALVMGVAQSDGETASLPSRLRDRERQRPSCRPARPRTRRGRLRCGESRASRSGLARSRGAGPGGGFPLLAGVGTSASSSRPIVRPL